MTYPDAPVNFVESLVSRSETTLGLSWDDGAQNGGSEIFSYTISQAIEDGDYSVALSVTS